MEEKKTAECTDNIEILKIKKIYRTSAPPLPCTIDQDHKLGSHFEDPFQKTHIEDCLKSYNGDNVLLKRRFAHYSTSICPPSFVSDVIESVNESHDQIYEINLNQGRKESVEPPKRTSCLMPFFLNNLDEKNLCFEYRSPIDFGNEDEPVRVMLRCTHAKFEFEIEPFFFSVALFDARTRTKVNSLRANNQILELPSKISENFNFDMNTNAIRHMIPTENCVDSSSISRSAIFSITNPHPDVYFVIRVEKVLQQGDVADSMDPYSRTDQKTKSQIAQKLADNARCFCERLGRYRMPVGWTAINLGSLVQGNREINHGFTLKSSSLDRRGQQHLRIGEGTKLRTRDESVGCRGVTTDYNGEYGGGVCGRIKSEQLAVSLRAIPVTVITLKQIFRSEPDKIMDDEIIKFLAEYRKSSFIKRLKPIPVNFKFEFSAVKNMPEGCIDPDFYRLKPLSDQIRRPIKEILEFTSYHDCSPNKFYRNILYVYPRHLTLSTSSRLNGSVRNISVKVQLMLGHDSTHPAAVMVNRSGVVDLSKEIFLPILYHQKNPYFYEELKIRLPAITSEHDHILFTIYHISCQRKEEVPLETVVGFTWLPLAKALSTAHERSNFYLPIAHDLPSDYCQLSPFDDSLSNVHWMDNKRASLELRLKLVSTIHHQDKCLESFFSSKPGTDDYSLRVCLESLAHANRTSLIRFGYIVLDKLMRLLCEHFHQDQGGVMSSLVFSAIVRVVDRISREGSAMDDIRPGVERRGVPYRSSILVSYAHFYCQANDSKCSRKIHEEIISQWGLSTGENMDLATSNAWFLFELSIRFLTLEAKNRRSKTIGNEDRRFFDDLTVLLHLLVDEIIIKSSSASNQDNESVRQLNWSIGFFIHDCIAIIDPNLVSDLIQIHLKKLESAKAADMGFTALELLKWDYLQVICSHEQFMMFNQCLQAENPDQQPVNLILKHLRSLVSTSDWKFDNLSFVECFQKAFWVVSTVLLVSERVWLKSVPLAVQMASVADRWESVISIVFNSSIFANLKRRNLNSIVSSAASNSDENTTETSEIIANTLLDVKSKRSSIVLGNDSECSLTSANHPQTLLHTNMLVCFLWVLKFLTKPKLKSLMSDLSQYELEKVLDRLCDCMISFEYKPKYVHFTATKSKLIARQPSRPFVSLTKKRNLTLHHQNQQKDSDGEFRDSTAPPSGRNGSLLLKRDMVRCAECSMIVLDTLSTIVNDLLSDCDHRAIAQTLKTYLLALSLHQSQSCLLEIMSQIKQFVKKFPRAIFSDQSNESLSELCLRLLQYCTSKLSLVRTTAAHSLYFLMKQNYASENNFAKIKMQITMSLSWLVGQTDHHYNETHLKSGLNHLLELCDSEKVSGSFAAQTRELVHNLNVIMSDTMKMRNHVDDPELIIDLMHRVANCYQTSPDLRLTWLQNMAQNHLQRSRYMEAGQCLVHGAALVSEYLAMSNRKDYMPMGCVSLQNVSVNVLEESAVSDDVVGVDNICCNGGYSTEQGFIGLLEQAAIFFVHAQAYELVNQIYKVLIPIFEANRDYKKLSQIHGKLNEYFGLIANQGSRRLFAAYFRVVFHGELFRELDGWEFVYKEPAFTKLVEIAQKLEDLFVKKFGSDRVVMVKESKAVDRQGLDIANRAYIQITFVEPYLDISELKHRQTHFEKSYGLRRFVYSTPFTLDGKVHGHLRDQYQRRTILTTERAFPYVKSRLAVVSSCEFVLTPIEVAIEDVLRKCDELRKALAIDPCDPKYLQVVLQGSVGAKVNAGPIEIANQFLSPTQESATSDQLKCRARLRGVLREFLCLCAQGLHVNKQLVGADQADYQKLLETDFEGLCGAMSVFVDDDDDV